MGHDKGTGKSIPQWSFFLVSFTTKKHLLPANTQVKAYWLITPATTPLLHHQAFVDSIDISVAYPHCPIPPVLSTISKGISASTRQGYQRCLGNKSAPTPREESPIVEDKMNPCLKQNKVSFGENAYSQRHRYYLLLCLASQAKMNGGEKPCSTDHDKQT